MHPFLSVLSHHKRSQAEIVSLNQLFLPCTATEIQLKQLAFETQERFARCGVSRSRLWSKDVSVDEGTANTLWSWVSLWIPGTESWLTQPLWYRPELAYLEASGTGISYSPYCHGQTPKKKVISGKRASFCITIILGVGSKFTSFNKGSWGSQPTIYIEGREVRLPPTGLPASAHPCIWTLRWWEKPGHLRAVGQETSQHS